MNVSSVLLTVSAVVCFNQFFWSSYTKEIFSNWRGNFLGLQLTTVRHSYYFSEIATYFLQNDKVCLLRKNAWPTCTTCGGASTPCSPRGCHAIHGATAVRTGASLPVCWTWGTTIGSGRHCACLILSARTALAIGWRARAPWTPRTHLGKWQIVHLVKGTLATDYGNFCFLISTLYCQMSPNTWIKLIKRFHRTR